MAPLRCRPRHKPDLLYTEPRYNNGLEVDRDARLFRR